MLLDSRLGDDGTELLDVAGDVDGFNVFEPEINPVILEAYRQDELTLECVMAFAVTDDQTRQATLWQGAPGWTLRNPGSIRDALTEDEIAGTDPRVQFVTLKAYEKSGGAVRRDLFSEGDEGVFILDAALLDSLVTKKLEKVAKAVKKEGWQWVEAAIGFDHEARSQFGRRHAEPVPLSEEEAAALAKLEHEADAFYDIEGDLDDDQQARLDEITQRLDELGEGEEIWPQEVLSIAGAVVTIDRHGEAEIIRGLVRPEDEPEQEEEESAAENGDSPARPVFPPALVQSLTEQRTAALAAALCERPDIALASVVHAIALDMFYSSGDSCIRLSASAKTLKGADGSSAADLIENRREMWASQLPGNPQDLWAWCLEADQSVLLDLLAFCAARSINAVLVKGERAGSERLQHADALGKALGFDMAAWFTPTAENYFARVTKAMILSALEEAKGVPPAPSWFSMKKAELAKLAEREVAAHPWLPAPLRSAA